MGNTKREKRVSGIGEEAGMSYQGAEEKEIEPSSGRLAGRKGSGRETRQAERAGQEMRRKSGQMEDSMHLWSPPRT